MSENMTDKQMEVILNLVADKFSNCKNMEEVAKAVQEVRNMAKKEKPNEWALGVQKGRWTCQSRPNCKIIINHLARERKREFAEIGREVGKCQELKPENLTKLHTKTNLTKGIMTA